MRDLHPLRWLLLVLPLLFCVLVCTAAAQTGNVVWAALAGLWVLGLAVMIPEVRHYPPMQLLGGVPTRPRIGLFDVLLYAAAPPLAGIHLLSEAVRWIVRRFK